MRIGPLDRMLLLGNTICSVVLVTLSSVKYLLIKVNFQTRMLVYSHRMTPLPDRFPGLDWTSYCYSKVCILRCEFYLATRASQSHARYTHVNEKGVHITDFNEEFRQVK